MIGKIFYIFYVKLLNSKLLGKKYRIKKIVKKEIACSCFCQIGNPFFSDWKLLRKRLHVNKGKF